MGGPGSPHQQGWGSCSGLLSQLLLSAMVITTLTPNARAIDTVLTTSHGAGCTVIPTLLLNNNSKAALFDKENSEDLRNGSGRAHGWTNTADGSIGGW